MINNVVLTGRLTKDIDLKYTQSGTAVGSFSVAVERKFKNAQGERETDFINCVIWRKSAENFAKFAGKGSLVGLEGSIQTRNYENNQGQRVYVTEVVVENFSLLESKKIESKTTVDTKITQIKVVLTVAINKVIHLLVAHTKTAHRAVLT